MSYELVVSIKNNLNDLEKIFLIFSNARADSRVRYSPEYSVHYARTAFEKTQCTEDSGEYRALESARAFENMRNIFSSHVDHF